MFLIGIAGGSGSGKTTFARKVVQNLGEAAVSILHQDHYYLETPPTHIMVHGQANYDHPAAFDWELFLRHLEEMKNGRPVKVPVYDYTASKRTAQTATLGPSRAILIEGIYALWDSRVRDLMDLRVFLNVDADIRFIRRLHRDIKERGRNIDSVIRQYYDTVRPMHHEHIETTQQFADVVVGEETDVAAGLIAAKIKDVLSS
jgi:uridine kinase